MQVDGKEEQRGAVLVQIADHVAAVDVAHDMFDRGEGIVDMRRVVHDQDDPGDDLQRQAEGQDDTPDPHPVEVLGRGDRQCVVH